MGAMDAASLWPVFFRDPQFLEVYFLLRAIYEIYYAATIPTYLFNYLVLLTSGRQSDSICLNNANTITRMHGSALRCVRSD